MRLPSRVCVLLGLALAAAPFIAGAPGCGSTGFDCPGIYDIKRIGADGQPDPCCDRGGPCPPAGAAKDAGSDADAAAADADGGPPSGDAGSDAADAADDAADADSGCPGTCLQVPPDGWFGPQLLWKGDAGATIACPPTAPITAYTGFADLDAGAASCGACGCEPSASNTCGPPEHLTASTAACPGGDAGVPLPFDPPPGWDGGCTNIEAIASGAKSLSSSPLTLTETCIADAGTPDGPTTPAGFASSVVACASTTSNCDIGHVCAPTAAGFQSCIYQQGDVACPASYPVRIAVAEGFDDQRACSSCACDMAAGSCTATLSVYGDSACSTFLFARAIDSTSTTTTPPCEDVAAPGTLGSKMLTGIKYTPGTCAPSGGEPTDGGVVATGVATFCCLP